LNRSSLSRFACTSLLLLALGPAPARGGERVATPTERILEATDTPTALRARLRAHADSVRAGDPDDAASALYWLGLSYARAGRSDSACAALTQAGRLRILRADAIALAEVAALAHRDVELDSALAALTAMPASVEDGVGPLAASARLWRAYARVRSGGEQAAQEAAGVARSELLARHVSPPRRALWAMRLGAVLAGAGDPLAWALLRPELLATRGTQPEILRLSRSVSTSQVVASGFDDWLALELRRLDDEAGAWLREQGARESTVRAADGFPLHVWRLPAASPTAPRVVMAAEPSPAARDGADSLVALLRRAGFGVTLFDTRGSGRSVAASCPNTESWLGREDAMTRALAGDYAAVAAVAAPAGAPVKLVFAASGPHALAAAMAARAEKRVRALLVAAPSPSPLERGALAAALIASRVPVFFATGPDNDLDNDVLDRLVLRLPPEQFRIVLARWPGAGYGLFRAGPENARRFTDWLAKALASPRATPPARRP
jgi:hypothetical protein